MCARLREQGQNGTLAGELIASILDDQTTWPLKDCLAERHPEECEDACYRCLLRYGNLQYHGLLDWRLGLAFLRATLRPEFACGTDGDYSTPELQGWSTLVERDLRRLEGEYRGVVIEKWDAGGAPQFAFRVEKEAPWALVVHPLWKDGRPAALRQQSALGPLQDQRVKIWEVDSFNLARRPTACRGQLREGSGGAEE